MLWIKLLEEMFLGMPSEYPWGDEMMLFLNVFNGALLLHPEDSALLRQYTATAINTAVHFNHLFSLSGYQWILPTMLQVLLLSLLQFVVDEPWCLTPSPPPLAGVCRLRERPAAEAGHRVLLPPVLHPTQEAFCPAAVCQCGAPVGVHGQT